MAKLGSIRRIDQVCVNLFFKDIQEGCARMASVIDFTDHAAGGHGHKNNMSAT